MSTNAHFYTMVGIHLTEEDINNIELNADSDEPIDAVEKLERLCEEYGLSHVPVDPMTDSSCVIGHVLFESDGWDETEMVSYKEVTAIQATPIMKFMNAFPLMISEHPIQYYTFVQVG